MNIIDLSYERRLREIRKLTGMSGQPIDLEPKIKIHDGAKEYIYTEEELSLDRFKNE